MCIFGRKQYPNLVYVRMPQENTQGMFYHCLPSNELVLLGGLPAHPATGTSRGNKHYIAWRANFYHAESYHAGPLNRLMHEPFTAIIMQQSHYQPPLKMTVIAAAVFLVLCLVFAYISIRFSRLTKQLKNSEERWKFALEGAGDGVWDWNVQADEVVISSRYKEMYGFTDEDVASNSAAWKGRIYPEDRASVERDIHACLKGETSHYVNEHRVVCKDGTIKWALARGMVVSWDHDGKPLRMIGTHADITERKNIENRMQHLAHYDLLTELPNRTLINDRLKQALAYAKREQALLALMFIDLDKFKPVNDTLGHEIGDLLLKQVAARLQQSVRASDTVARIGGDEFVVLLPVIDSAQDAAVVADKIIRALEIPFEIEKHTINISSSIGIAIYPEHGADQKSLQINADMAMYHAKESGRGNAKFFQAGMEKVEMPKGA